MSSTLASGGHNYDKSLIMIIIISIVKIMAFQIPGAAWTEHSWHFSSRFKQETRSAGEIFQPKFTGAATKVIWLSLSGSATHMELEKESWGTRPGYLRK